jgi:GR25 family glycosyltransferase involved in LPS biosynthesis
MLGNILFICINLDRAPERRRAMETKARHAGIELQFIQAIDGSELNLDDVPGYDRKGRLQYAQDLKPGEVACVLKGTRNIPCK